MFFSILSFLFAREKFFLGVVLISWHGCFLREPFELKIERVVIGTKVLGIVEIRYSRNIVNLLFHFYSINIPPPNLDANAISHERIVWIPFMTYFVFLSFVVSRLPFYIKTKEGIKRVVRIFSMLSRGSTHWLKLAFPKYYRSRNTRLLMAPRLWHGLYLDTIV